MKKLVALACALLSASLVFAQSVAYRTALNQAKIYEGQKRWAYALGSYYDAITASDDASLKQEAVDAYNALANTIIAGNPGTGRYNAFDIHDEWKNLLLDAEKYGTEYGRFNISVGKLTMGALNYTARTASYESAVTITDSDRYRKVIGVIQQGYKAAYRSDWTDLPLGDETYEDYAWPIISTQKHTGTNFKPNDVALLAYPINNSANNLKYYNAFAMYMLRVKGESSNTTMGTTLYDIKLNIVDARGNEVVAAKRFLLNGATSYDRQEYWDDYADPNWSSYSGLSITTKCTFEGITPAIMDRIDSGELRVNVLGVYLEYGKYSYTDDLGGRRFIKNFPEISMPLGKISVIDASGTDTKKKLFDGAMEYKTAGNSIALVDNFLEDFVHVQGNNTVYSMNMAKIETPQAVFESVMGINPSRYKKAYAPVTNVSWYDAVVFCNKLSVMKGLEPCYSVNGSTDVSTWGYVPGKGYELDYTVSVNNKATGYRLPTKEEWLYAAHGGPANENYTYSGSNNVNEVAWYDGNTDGSQPMYVGQKAANSLGIYDMSGNVREWIWDAYSSYSRYHLGGYYNSSSSGVQISNTDYDYMENQYNYVGFRIITSEQAEEEPVRFAATKALVDSFLSDFARVEGNGSVFTMNMAKIETPQIIYYGIMGVNPSSYPADYNPVTNISWYDAVVFCNKLSMIQGLEPCYSVNGSTDPATWNYTPNTGDYISSTVCVDVNATGYRLPTRSEWIYAAKEGKRNSSYTYSGSNNADAVAWYDDNSGGYHPMTCGTKAPNALGIYDMSGNVREWVWDSTGSYRYHLGGYYDSYSSSVSVDNYDYDGASNTYNYVGFRIITSERNVEEAQILANSKNLCDNFLDFVEVTGNDSVYSFAMAKIEVPQVVFQQVMGINPSNVSGAYYPVTNVSWYDALVFCNKLSALHGLTPVYKVNGSNNVLNWDYSPCHGYEISGTITVDNSANGYRLPTRDEWNYAAHGGLAYERYTFSGSNDADAVAWYDGNSFDPISDYGTSHAVGLKQPNSLGIYDMSGNVREWVWDAYSSYSRYHLGGYYNSSTYGLDLDNYDYDYKENTYNYVGFRVILSHRAQEEQERYAEVKALVDNMTTDMAYISSLNLAVAKIEVTQGLFQEIMGFNPSWNSGSEYLPVSNVSWNDAVYFCNLLSVRDGLTPCYSLNGSTAVSRWRYTPGNGDEFSGTISCNTNANGYRLPTKDEWILAAKGGNAASSLRYSGSNNIDEVGWYEDNSSSSDVGSDSYHVVATKKANSLGIYDMTGNVREWVWDKYSQYSRYHLGGSYYNSSSYCAISSSDYDYDENRYSYVGFRIVRKGL